MDSQNILNKSAINNEKSLLSLSMEKIEEYIKILEEFQNKCEVEAKFVEADLAQKKIAQLVKIKNKKNLLNRKNQQIEERDELERSQKEELDEFNKDQDKKFYELNEKFQEMQNKLEEQHNSQLKDLQQKYEEKYSNYIIKPSPELINLNKKLELYVQKKDYQNAHQTQIEIADLTKKEKEKFEKEKYKTIQKEIENLQKKHLNETKGLELKIQSAYNSFKKNRALKVQELLLKYKNQFRDLENKQSNDIKNLEKIVQGGMLKQGKTINYSNKVRDKNINFNKTATTK
jgi:hypothetical protein